MVLAPAFVNTPAILDLDAEWSVVRQFLDRVFDVYPVESGDPRGSTSRSRWTITSAGTSLTRSRSTAPLAAAYAALAPDDVATLGLQGPPLEFHAEGGMLDFRELVERVDVRGSSRSSGTSRRRCTISASRCGSRPLTPPVPGGAGRQP